MFYITFHTCTIRRIVLIFLIRTSYINMRVKLFFLSTDDIVVLYYNKVINLLNIDLYKSPIYYVLCKFYIFELF